MGKRYLLLTLRHNSFYGEEYCLFWGERESKGGYNSNPYLAHRFTEEEMLEMGGSDDGDIFLDIEKLGIPAEYPKETNKNILCLVEKGTINRLYGLNIKRR